MRITGEAWDAQDIRANGNVRRQFYKRVDALKTLGYDSLRGRTASAGGTVEFQFIRGGLRVRASARYCEAAQRAAKGEWETMSLIEWAGAK